MRYQQPPLIDTPADTPRHYKHRIVLLTGPSGVGKTSMTRRLGVPVIALDDFYRDGDETGLPGRFGIVDWDHPGSWNAEAALECLDAVCRTGHAEVPVYDIPSSRRTGRVGMDAGESPIVVAEGLFADEISETARARGLLAASICFDLPQWTTFWRRLLRDWSESRKPPTTLVRRGITLCRAQPAFIVRCRKRGFDIMTPKYGEKVIRDLANPT